MARVSKSHIKKEKITFGKRPKLKGKRLKRFYANGSKLKGKRKSNQPKRK